MKIAIAQTRSSKGDIHKNIQNHLLFIEAAIRKQVDLILFPELSITGYEPTLAKKLATNLDSHLFDPFEHLSNTNDITIGIGMPTTALAGVQISMLIFQPNQKRTVYAKQLLHADELPYFVCGDNQVFLNVKNKKIAIGICYESLQRAHFLNAKQAAIDIYIASVAKQQKGIEQAYSYFSKIASEFETPILMANCVGYCDNFLSIGQSAVWSDDGQLIGKLDNQNQGLLIFDTVSNTIEAIYNNTNPY